jgi:hypothetical protein
MSGKERTVESELFFILCDFLDRYKQVQGKGLDARDKLISEVIQEMLKVIRRKA